MLPSYIISMFSFAVVTFWGCSFTIFSTFHILISVPNTYTYRYLFSTILYQMKCHKATSSREIFESCVGDEMDEINGNSVYSERTSIRGTGSCLLSQLPSMTSFPPTFSLLNIHILTIYLISS